MLVKSAQESSMSISRFGHSVEAVLGCEKNDADGMRAEWAGSPPVPHCRQNSVGTEQKDQAEVIYSGTE